MEGIQGPFCVKANRYLRNVFENVLINAVKHNENEHVRITVNISRIEREEGSFLRFEFKDNGMGIPDEKKRRIFEKGANNVENLRGLGLGLSLVKKLTEMFGGRIWVEDKVRGKPSRGSNFIIQLPEMDKKK